MTDLGKTFSTEPVSQKRRFPVWAIVLIVVAVGCLCLCILVGIGAAAYFMFAPASSQVISMPEGIEATVEAAIPSLEPPFIEEATATPVPAQAEPAPTLTVQSPPELELTLPPPDATGLTGEQRVGEYSLFDDFSSEMLGWPVVEDNYIELGYQDGAYRFKVKEPDYYDWAYFPVDFIP